jgi:pyruvate dehydrogenase E2 component (dihydrolipoamide acetyltransferase)
LAAAPGTPAAAATDGTVVSDGDEVEELTATRRAIAANLTRSWTEIPHVTVWGPADAGAVLAARKESGGPLEAHLTRAVLPVLREFPEFNASFDGSTLTRRATVNMGYAVAADAGLVVPVVRDVADLSPSDLAGRIEAAITAATSRRLSPDDMTGATFTISNVGAVGGGYGTPLIPHGTTAILSVGRAKDDVVVRDGGIRIAPVFPLALSFDHRVIDGVRGSQFLNRIVEELETYRG